MKYTILVLFIMVVGIAGIGSFMNQPVEVMNEKVDHDVTLEEVVVEEADVVDSAKAELERINLELDAEETKVLEEKAKALQAFEAEVEKLNAQIANLKKAHQEDELVIEARLERIREARTSF